MMLKRLVWTLFIAILLAGTVRLFLLDSYRVASGAMSETRMSGDRLLVEKWTLGSRIPGAIANPFSTSKPFQLLKPTSSVHRLPGISRLHRNDLLVYNQPQESDTLPINLRPVLISRCVGLPGDLVSLEGQRLFINKALQKRGVDAMYCFNFPASAKSTIRKIANNRPFFDCKDSCFTFLTRHEYSRMAKHFPDFRSLVRPFSTPFDTLSTYIPYEGLTLSLDSVSFHTWQQLINTYDRARLVETSDGGYLLNGARATRYTFKQDYYFVLNDHQGYLNDSRTFGLVPASHIIGRSLIVLYSPAEKRFLNWFNGN